MKLSRIGRASLAIVASLSMGLGMTACGGGTIGFLWVMSGKNASNAAGNSITGFKIDDYTGNLTEMVGSPFQAAGVNPRMAVLKPGGRFLYVLNQGDSSGNSGGIVEFSVGGDGVLTYQNTFFSQGQFPQWLQIDSSGSYLYALDKLAPGATAGAGTGTVPAGCAVKNCGSITVFAIAGDTGRLSLVTNNSIKVNGNNITYFPTGPEPFMAKIVSSGYLMTVNIADNPTTNPNQSVTSYQIGTAGQLTAPANQGTNLEQSITATNITSITSGGTYVYLTDGATNTIIPYTVSNGVLASVNGGTVANFVTGVKPVWTLTDSQNKFVYVLNQSTDPNNTTAAAESSISAYSIDSSTGKLTRASGTSNPYKVGGIPICMIQDPSTKYIYTSNSVPGSVTGFEINKGTGELNVLRHGSQFDVTGQPACLVASGNVN